MTGDRLEWLGEERARMLKEKREAKGKQPDAGETVDDRAGGDNAGED